ncbi:MAG TPA: class A beta-lactamase [Rhodanobacteraceae bacterium]|nr:class A beta-lactamase [Rhodanobacteraceae bacterium]
MLSRRQVLQGMAALLVAGAARRVAAGGDTVAEALERRFAAIEIPTGGRLGVAILDTGSGLRAGRRADERFPLCSTFKVLAAGAVLQRVDAGHEDLARRIRFGKDRLVDYSPVTEHHAGGAGMSLGEICAAALDYSDNTAGNLLLETLGGPPEVTRFARSLGDPVTRLDRTETRLNEALPGDPRDTTTPQAMLRDLHALLLGNVLSPASRRQLLAWMTACTTGAKRLRAGVPADWQVADKTGSGDHGTANDIGILAPPGRAPVLVTVYLTRTRLSWAQLDPVIARVGAAVAAVSAGKATAA